MGLHLNIGHNKFRVHGQCTQGENHNHVKKKLHLGKNYGCGKNPDHKTSQIVKCPLFQAGWIRICHSLTSQIVKCPLFQAGWIRICHSLSWVIVYLSRGERKYLHNSCSHIHSKFYPIYTCTLHKRLD